MVLHILFNGLTLLLQRMYSVQNAIVKMVHIPIAYHYSIFYWYIIIHYILKSSLKLF